MFCVKICLHVNYELDSTERNNTAAHSGNEALTPDIWGIEAELLGVAAELDDCAFTMLNRASWKRIKSGAIQNMIRRRRMAEIDTGSNRQGI